MTESDQGLPPTGRTCCDGATEYWRRAYVAEANENTAIREALGIETDDPDETVTARTVVGRLDEAAILIARLHSVAKHYAFQHDDVQAVVAASKWLESHGSRKVGGA